MGGYGALKLGLAKPESFAAVASLSGAVSLSSTSFGELLKSVSEAIGKVFLAR